MTRTAGTSPQEQPEGKAGQERGAFQAEGGGRADVLRWKELAAEEKKLQPGGASGQGGAGAQSQARETDLGPEDLGFVSTGLCNQELLSPSDSGIILSGS